MEEVISTYLSPYLERAIYNEDAANATPKELLDSWLTGAAMGGVFQGIDAAANHALSGQNKTASTFLAGLNEDLLEEGDETVPRRTRKGDDPFLAALEEDLWEN